MGVDSLRDRLVAILEWFQLRGDIIRGARNRYHSLPPYVLGGAALTRWQAFPLFGDSLVETRLTEALQGYAVLKKKLIYEEHFENNEEAIPTLIPIGIERTLHSKTVSENGLEAILESNGITVLDVSVLRSSIPKVGEFFWPPRHVFATPPALPGNWEIYDPNLKVSYQAGRWRLEPDWQMSSYRLVRFHPGTEYTSGSRRYFLHEKGQTFEISRDEAQWWQFRFDLDAANTTTWYLKAEESELWINGPLPNAIGKWLRFIVSKPPRKKQYWNVFTLLPDQYDEAKMLAWENLGVRVATQNEPPLQ